MHLFKEKRPQRGVHEVDEERKEVRRNRLKKVRGEGWERGRAKRAGGWAVGAANQV